MPCFKGIAVSVHANGAPLHEHGMLKSSRNNRISAYIPVPAPQLNEKTGQHEAARFAISITLLTPGHAVPYTKPKPTAANPDPEPLYAGPAPPEAKDNATTVAPFQPRSNSGEETIAAYIYFDGRAKEEVATLLRPGEETWVNSRWVHVPDADGGGLAEREFLFREVGLERWLNGLDLKGHDAAEKVEKRRQKFERRHCRQKSAPSGDGKADKAARPRDSFAYGNDDSAPSNAAADDDSDDLSDDDEPPEATGQIKVAMFRVLASGEIKKGEYSPQFDAHDDDEEGENKGESNGAFDANVEHTTSFAKPKSLDPKSISTQTVTGIDPPDSPYATFTFFYRGQRQLSKMGVVKPNNSKAVPGSNPPTKGLDFSNLTPLKATGTVGFNAYRDQRKKKRNGFGGTAVDSDDDEDDVNPLEKMEDEYDKDVKAKLTEDAGVQAAYESIDRIHLKRQHSPEPDGHSNSPNERDSPTIGALGNVASPVDTSSILPPPGGVTNLLAAAQSTFEDTGSPLKKQRPSAKSGANDNVNALPPVFSSNLGDALAEAVASESAAREDLAMGGAVVGPKDEEDLEL